MDKVTINGVTYSLGDTVICKGRYGLEGGVITAINEEDEYPLETDSDYIKKKAILGSLSRDKED